MNDRDLFKKTFDAVPAPQYLAARAVARADEKTPRRAPRRALRTAALIVLAVALLSACAVAVHKITTKPDLVTQCNIELDTLRSLGLFHAEFEVTEADQVPDFDSPLLSAKLPELPEEKYEGIIELRNSYNAGRAYSYTIKVDTGTGKITRLDICARPQENWIPTHTGFFSDPGSRVNGFYDNYDAILDPEITLGQMCAAWARYQGFDRYELPLDAAEDVKFIDAPELESWHNDLIFWNDGLTAAFYRGKGEPEYYTFKYSPTGAGPYFSVNPAEGPYAGKEYSPIPREEDPAGENRQSAVKLINAELDALRELGLLRSGLEVTLADCDERSEITARRIGEENTGKLHLTSSSREHSDCNYYLCYDAVTGKLDCLALCPKPADGSLRVADAYDAGFGAAIDGALTIGEYCALWAEYQGYERWELPEGVSEDTRYLDAHTLPAWPGGILNDDTRTVNGLVIDFYRPGGAEPEHGYVKYGPSGIGPCVTLGNDYVYDYGRWS